MDYVQPEGIIKRTGYTDKKDWYLLVIKELFDNAVDWLWKEYPGAADSKITAKITLDKRNFNCKIRNSNPKNIVVFTPEQLQNIFNYEMTYGSKQNEFKISRGTLGDAMKYIAALPYVLINLGRDKSNDFEDLQWKTPLYIRHNGIEQEIFIIVDEANSIITSRITPVVEAKSLKHTDTEIEVTYPIINEVREPVMADDTGELIHGSLDFDTVAYYCKQHKAGTTDISFDIEIIDKRVSPPKVERITQQAAHAISDQWTNIPSIRAYTPQEFRKKIFGVHDKSNTTIYKVLRTFREGTQLKKRADLDVSVAQLINNPEKIKALYYELRNDTRLSKSSPKKLSLPYSNVIKQQPERSEED
ncbi:MAG: hypothetical protein M3275_01575 [Thermoproteota archaeon]|nr:hypothetical protein [Thermoproteota archaeon]